MTVYEIDPTRDERWDEFIETHPQASIFHTSGWLEALRRTYGYIPIAFTTSPPDSPIDNGLPFCQIASWVTGRRLVSLPFSDHCTPLVEDSKQLTCLLAYLRNKLAHERWRYIEIRPTTSITENCADFGTSRRFYLHKLNLGPNLDDILHSFHKDCVQRKIHRSWKEGVVDEKGTSDSLLTKFYELLVKTRRRHGLPAQPFDWFRNLVACLGERVRIRVASKDGRPIASILTLSHKYTLTYKYGCSEQRFNKLGGMQLLLWNAVQDAKNNSLSELDMGRSDSDDAGLIAFKDRWGTTRAELVYVRYPINNTASCPAATQGWVSKYLWSHAPGGLLAAVGRALYKHMG